MFFSVDRILQYALELRRPRSTPAKTMVAVGQHPNDGSIEKHEKNNHSEKIRNIEEKEKAELAEEVEIAMLSNALARTFSNRRRVAVMSAVDGIEIRDATHKEGETNVSSSLQWRRITGSVTSRNMTYKLRYLLLVGGDL
uniref:Uncharacterized protein n=1 Tax=Angiostrongylus cantonensis TaxID=6313 RepID=A0A0K0D0G0_ANGCA